MISEYHRPQTLEDALELLAREHPLTIPLAGGTTVNRPTKTTLAVVDLQDLGLNTIQRRGNSLFIGAMVTLQRLMETLDIPQALVKAIRHEATHTLRHMATVAGSLVAADGRSPFATTMLALDAQVTLAKKNREVHDGIGNVIRENIRLGEIYPLRTERLKGGLILEVAIPVNVALAYEYVARTPADQPIVCVAVARWQSGRTRIALGGYGTTPILAFDSPESMGGELAASNAYSQAGDSWASAEYRQEMAGLLARRCIVQIESNLNKSLHK